MTNSTTLRGEAGVVDAQAGLAVGGLWRYRTTNHDVAHPGGAAAVYDVFAVASANVFAPPDVDSTDYNWYLQIKASGQTPTGNTPAGNPITVFRKVGELDWSGTAITGIRQLVTPAGTVTPLHPTTPNAGVPALRARAAAVQTAPVFQAEDSTGAAKFFVMADGRVGIGAAPAAGYAIDGSAVPGGLRLTSNDPTVGAIRMVRTTATTGEWKLAVDTTGHLVLRDELTPVSPLSIEKGAPANAFRITVSGLVALGSQHFAGGAPVALNTGWGSALATNFVGAVSRKSLTAAYTIDELRDVVATVVDALRAKGLLGG